MVSRNNIAERNAFLESRVDKVLTPALFMQLMEWDWDAEWPEVDTDGCLTGRVVGPDPDYTVVDVVQDEDGDYYSTPFHNGSVGSMAMCSTVRFQQREQLTLAAAECLRCDRVCELEIAEGGPKGWVVVLGLQCEDVGKLAEMIRQIGCLQ